MADNRHIPLEKLYIDLKNPRSDVQKNEDDAINELFDSSKLLAIIKSITENGFYEVNRPLVEPIGPDDYQVRDGNRRIAALKVIQNPKILHSESAQKQVEDLILKNLFTLNPVISCVVSSDEKYIKGIINMMHASGQDGSLEPWTAIMKTRNEMNEGKVNPNTFSLKVMDYLKENTLISKEEYRKMPISTLTRVYSSTPFTEKFKIKPSSEGYTAFDRFSHDKKQQIAQISLKICKEKIKVGDLYDTDKIEAFLDSFTKITPQQSVPQPPPVAPNSPRRNRTSVTLFDAKSRPSKLSGKDFIKVEKVLDELKELNIYKFPIACAGLLRIYLDLITMIVVTVPKQDSQRNKILKDRLLDLIDDLTNREKFGDRILPPSKVEAIKTELNKEYGICNVKTIQAALHNPDFHVDAQALQTQWAHLSPLMNLIHYHVDKKGKDIFVK